MKFIDMNIMVEFLIVTKVQLVIELWVLELGVVDRRSDKEAENWMLLPKFLLFNITTFEVWGDAKMVFRVLYITPKL